MLLAIIISLCLCTFSANDLSLLLPSSTFLVFSTTFIISVRKSVIKSPQTFPFKFILHWCNHQKMDVEDNLANRVASFSYYLKTGDQENIVPKIGGLVEDPISATISKEISFPSGRIKSSVIKPSYAINFSNSIDSQDKVSSHRFASLPSLVDDPPENFAFKVKPGPVQDPNAALVLARTGSTYIEKMNPTNGEIGVFGADKYFNMKLDYESRMKNESKHQALIDLPGMKSNLRPATPSVYSEASSWNSGTALLKNLPKNTTQTKPKMALGRRIIASLGCTGPCMDSRAVYVDESGRGDPGMGYGAKLPQPAPKRGEPFAFPILNSDTHSLAAKMQLENEKLVEFRKSLDVFGSGTMKKGDIATNLERKLSVLTWDAIPKASNHPTTIGSTSVCDDMASDASSDLFEIENISGNGFPILSMQAAGDDLSGCMTPTTRYAPSEASIEWSVVTASAADFSSVISDYDEKHIGIGGDIIPLDAAKKNFRSKQPMGKEAQKFPSNELLGCKSQKAVNVAETVHKSTRVERY